MNVPPTYTITHKTISLISKIETNKTIFSTTTIPDKIINNLKHQSLLKSSVFSAQIEGNTLSPQDITQGERVKGEGLSEEKKYERQEIENIITALSYMRDHSLPDIIDVPYLLRLHKLILNKLVHPSQAGVIRTQPSAIFDSYGNVIYMTPPPSEINNLLIDLLHLVNDTTDIFPLIKAPIAHMTFEKIHPFLDGNGRVGRLLSQAILAKHGYHFNWLLSMEELLQERKQTYYALLDQSDATEFIEFMLQIMLDESERLKHELSNLENPQQEDFLLPRRKEILAIIKDHTLVSFDQIQRRFAKVPGRTLRYDIKQLEKEGFIRKVGTTRGAMYQTRVKGKG